jgi:molecular chaperone HscB
MDPFATLGIEPKFELDLKAVEKRHRDLSRAVHPDRAAGDRVSAALKASEVNEAWRAVKDPIRRAEALFERAGIAVGERNEPKPSQAFLMHMLEQREALEEAKGARDLPRVHALAEHVQDRADAAERALAAGFEKGGDKPLVEKLGELRFYRRFLDEVSAIQDELDHGAP